MEGNARHMQNNFKYAAAGALSAALISVGAFGTAIAQDDDTISVTAASGTTYELSQDELDDAMGYVYCEIVFDYGDAGQDILSTSPVAECDLDWWDGLDMDEVASEQGANFAAKNGPQTWSSDKVIEKTSDPVTVAGVGMVYGATLAPGTVGGPNATPNYALFNTAKEQELVWNAGSPTYQLVDGNGYHYILQGAKVDQSELPTLGDQYQNLPEGWSYQPITYDTELDVNLTPNGFIPSVQDEFDQIFILIPTEALDS